MAAIELPDAIALKQQDATLSVCLLEKGAEIGAHLLSGALLDPVALRELLPESWQEAPLGVPVTDDQVHLLQSDSRSLQLPHWAVPPRMHNDGSHIISLGTLCRWLGKQAEALGVEIYPGFAASTLIVEEGRVRGVVTGDLGLDKEGNPNASTGTPEQWSKAVLDAKHGDPNSVVMLSIGDPQCPWWGDRLCKLVDHFPYHYTGEILDLSYAPAFDKATDLVEEACAGFVPPPG